MSEVTRIWLAAPGKRPLSELVPPDLAPAVTLDVAALAAAPNRADGGRGDGGVRTWLQGLAAEHRGLELLLVGDSRLVGLAAGLVLGVPADSVQAATVTLDWPGDDSAPQLIGVDLDWIPPFNPRGRAKFPGGPGVAGTARG